MPVRAHADDAGMDLLTPIDVTIPKDGSEVVDTGCHILIPKGFYGKLESKSGLNIKNDVVCLGGTIDAGYTGSIRVKLYNFGSEDYHFSRGEKLVQLILIPCITPDPVRVTSLGVQTERGDNGFGSSGR